jgi:hypothetical protein
MIFYAAYFSFKNPNLRKAFGLCGCARLSVYLNRDIYRDPGQMCSFYRTVLFLTEPDFMSSINTIETGLPGSPSKDAVSLDSRGASSTWRSLSHLLSKTCDSVTAHLQTFGEDRTALDWIAWAKCCIGQPYRHRFGANECQKKNCKHHDIASVPLLAHPGKYQRVLGVVTLDGEGKVIHFEPTELL